MSISKSKMYPGGGGFYKNISSPEAPKRSPLSLKVLLLAFLGEERKRGEKRRKKWGLKERILPAVLLSFILYLGFPRDSELDKSSHKLKILSRNICPERPDPCPQFNIVFPYDHCFRFLKLKQ